MGLHDDHFTLDERRQLYRLKEAKVPVRSIAERLGRHRSSIYRELRRNWFDDGPWLRGSFPVSAQEATARRRRRQDKLYANPKGLSGNNRIGFLIL